MLPFGPKLSAYCLDLGYLGCIPCDSSSPTWLGISLGEAPSYGWTTPNMGRLQGLDLNDSCDLLSMIMGRKPQSTVGIVVAPFLVSEKVHQNGQRGGNQDSVLTKKNLMMGGDVDGGNDDGDDDGMMVMVMVMVMMIVVMMVMMMMMIVVVMMMMI